MKRGVLVILFVIIFFQFVSADVISLNSGGTRDIVIDSGLGGFFSGSVQALSTCGNGLVETPYEACDDKNYVSGDGCFSNCTVEANYTCTGEPSVCTATPAGADAALDALAPAEEEAATPASAGVEGDEEVITEEVNIRVDPMTIKRDMLINKTLEDNLGITNLNENSSTTFSVYSSGFDPDLIVNFWDSKNKGWTTSFSLTLAKGGTENLRVRFSAPSVLGNYNGTIYVDGKNISVSLNVREQLLLFDSNIIVLNEDYFVPKGDKLRTSVTLIPLGDKERMDVTLNYVIKDYSGRVYLTRSETILVENQINFKRNFDTGFLPLGQYIIGLELIYINGVAPSSAHFEITVARQNTFFGKIVFFLINAILIILILIIVIIVLRILKYLRENRKKDESEKLVKKWTSENDESFKRNDNYNMKGKY